MVKQESFLDSGLSITNGLYAWYDEKGNLDSMAQVNKGHKENWMYCNDSLKTIISINTEMVTYWRKEITS